MDTKVELSRCVTGTEITQKPAIEAAKLQAIFAIISRMGRSLSRMLGRAEDAELNLPIHHLKTE